MRPTLVIVVIALLEVTALWTCRPAFADGVDPAETLFRKAQEDDREGAFARALEGYEAARALDPSSRFVPFAETRAAQLRAHAEGGFAPYAELETIRRDPARASDGATIDALVRDAASFPPGAVRVEAWALAAEAYARRLGRPRDAEALYRQIAGDPQADPVLAKSAARELVTLLVARGDLDGAREAAGGDEKLAREVARLTLRHKLHLASILVLAVGALLVGRATRSAGLARGTAALRRAAPLVIAYAAYIAVGGALLANGYEAGTAKPFLVFGAALVPVLFAARAWGVAGSPARAPRVARAALCASGALAAAFLVLESVDATYLEGLGL